MKATILGAPRDIRLEDVPDPTVVAPTDALVRVTAACVCGSDLWPYRGINEVTEPTRIGHEFVGIVEEVGSEVRSLRAADFVIANHRHSCIEVAGGEILQTAGQLFHRPADARGQVDQRGSRCHPDEAS